MVPGHSGLRGVPRRLFFLNKMLAWEEAAMFLTGKPWAQWRKQTDRDKRV